VIVIFVVVLVVARDVKVGEAQRANGEEATPAKGEVLVRTDQRRRMVGGKAIVTEVFVVR
jgi:hypothetical protein